MFQPITRWSVRLVQRYLPDPFLFAILLTFVVFAAGWWFTPAGPLEMVRHWGEGFWGLLEFSMQMVLVLVTGYVLAQAPPVRRLLIRIAGMVRSPGQAVMLTTFVSAVASWLSWGFGLVVGALIAKEVAKKVTDVDYRVLVAGAYTGFIVWHAGISGSVPLKIATDDSFGITVPTSETIFAAFSLGPALFLILTLPLFIRFLQPRKEERVMVDPGLLEDSPSFPSAAREEVSTPAEKLEQSRWISWIIGAMGLIYIGMFLSENGGQLDLNIVIFIFLILGLILHQTPKRYLGALFGAVRETGGIVIQFPFYAGIMGMMSLSGLGKVISQGFVSLSSETTFPLFAFLSAGVLNIFVPSGGGQWAIQGPIMLPAGQALGVNPAKTAMAVAWGDAWTNLVQPFWALPLLAIAKLGARDIMGFCLLALFYSGVVIGLGLLFL
ncbi:short-chain fatty acids transporter [Melghirimyces profundicolus]|uniref:Short-chain fatty acids transporter n=1 Tax=Melghirimyces profundicolus TaxID=1242148 RepID=A0A2T6BQD8_9BACL|nr:short-chain fatty acid transporter [Melghirimyces profundicolus]PTX58310.1 short-chain fatty acids transporter [Melghirimyces profundicolus]